MKANTHTDSSGRLIHQESDKMLRESLHVNEMTCQMPSALTEYEENRNSLVKESYSTKHGKMLVAKIEDALLSPYLDGLVGKVNLIFTSPPFPLIRKKATATKLVRII